MPTWDSLNRQVVRCERCPRLREYCREIAREKRRAFRDQTYWGKPVPNFGPKQPGCSEAAGLLIVGLAPAAHGANRTGRMFTGDRSGEWLYRALHKAGFANQAESHDAHDGLQLIDCSITAMCHCAPPDNKPTIDEIQACRPWLEQTIDLLPVRVFLALGGMAWGATLDQIYEREWLSGRRPKFAHGASVELAGNRWLLGSYHPSQQNTFTGRLTEPMLDRIFAQARKLLGKK